MIAAPAASGRPEADTRPGLPWTIDTSGNLKTRADVAQLVERNLAKVEVAGSIPVVRSRGWLTAALFGDVAEWLGKGLQNLVPGFDSRRRLVVG